MIAIPFARIPRHLKLLATGGICLAFLMMTSRMDAHGLELSVQQLSDKDPAGLVDGEVITVGEAKTLLAIRSARYRPGVNLIYGMEDLATQVRHHPRYIQLAREAEKQGQVLSESEHNKLDSETRAFKKLILFEEAISSRVANPTLEMLRLLYEETKDTHFRTPERLLVQKLSIPFHDDQSQMEALEHLTGIQDKINEGMPLREAIGDNELTPVSLTLLPDQMEDSSLLDALKAAENRGAIKPRVEGNHAVLYYRQLYIPHAHVPLQSSLEALTSLFRNREHKRLVADYLGELASQPGMIRVLEPNLESVGTLALDSDILLIVGGEAITRGELKDAMGWNLNITSIMELDEFVDLALRTGLVQEHLMGAILQEKGLQDHPAVTFFREQFQITLMARRILEERALEEPLLVADGDALEQWRRERAVAGRLPGEVNYDKITIRSDDGREEWRAHFDRISTHEEFRHVANRLMREDSSAIWMSGLLAHVSELPSEASEKLASMDFPSLVIEEGETKVVYWLREANPDETPNSGELERSRQMLWQYRLQDRVEAKLEEMKSDVPVEILLPINNY